MWLLRAFSAVHGLWWTQARYKYLHGIYLYLKSPFSSMWMDNWTIIRLVHLKDFLSLCPSGTSPDSAIMRQQCSRRPLSKNAHIMSRHSWDLHLNLFLLCQVVVGLPPPPPHHGTWVLAEGKASEVDDKAVWVTPVICLCLRTYLSPVLNGSLLHDGLLLYTTNSMTHWIRSYPSHSGQLRSVVTCVLRWGDSSVLGHRSCSSNDN